jgi:hypothetical protein
LSATQERIVTTEGVWSSVKSTVEKTSGTMAEYKQKEGYELKASSRW